MQIWNWLTQNWTEVVAAVGGVVLAARIIVKLTPTNTDNVVVERIVNFLKGVGLKID